MVIQIITVIKEPVFDGITRRSRPLIDRRHNNTHTHTAGGEG